MDQLTCSRCGRTLTLEQDATAAPCSECSRLGPTQPEPPLVPGYELLGELGRGGMGVVYKARQFGLDRVVALKMLLGGGHAGGQILARFRGEARTVAGLQHPNIVQVYEVGEHGGLPFFSMEFIDGGCLADHLRNGPLAARTAAGLGETVARAIHAAHEQGVVHRDLKPGNVLLSRKRLEEAIPKVADFGLAKQVDVPGQTLSGAVLGTPSYMAPEQAQGRTKDVGPAADVYGLGAILYECLTGRPPFLAATPLDTLLQVLEQEPVPVRRLNPQVPRDLETICLKCLRKDPRQRYPAACGLADDLRRFLDGEPIKARPVGGTERVAKWARRRPAVAGLLLLVVLVAVVGFGLVTWKWRDAEQARAAEQQGRRDVEQALYFNRVAFADRERSLGNLRQARTLLDACPPELRAWEWHYLNRLSHGELHSVTAPDGLPVNCLAVSPDGRTVAAGCGQSSQPGSGGMVQLCDAATLAPRAALRGPAEAVDALTFSPDGTRLAAATVGADVKGAQGQAAHLADVLHCEVWVWDVAAAKSILRLPDHTSAGFAPGGKVLGAGRPDQTVRVWNLDTGVDLFGLPRHPGTVTQVVFSADGKWLATAWNEIDLVAMRQGVDPEQAWTRGVKVWDAHTGAKAFSLDGSSGPQFSPDGTRLATLGTDHQAHVWDPATGRELAACRGHALRPNQVSFSGDGKRLATAGKDRTARVWDAATGDELLVLRGHGDAVTDARFVGDGTRLVTAGEDGTVKAWSAVTDPEFRQLRGHASFVTAVAFAPPATAGAGPVVLASAGTDGVRLWDVAAGRPLAHLAEGRQSVAFSPDGTRLAAGSREPVVRVWDVAGLTSGGDRAPPAPVTLTGHTGAVPAVAFSPDGRHLASASVGAADPTNYGEVIVWDLAAGQKERALVPADLAAPMVAVAYSPDGKHLATAGMDGRVRVWDPASGQELFAVRAAEPFEGQYFAAITVAFSPDGTRLAAAVDNALAPRKQPEIGVWDAATGAPLLRLRGHALPCSDLAFSPDGRRLASASFNANGFTGEVKLWDAASGAEILALPGLRAVAFSRDGRFLAAATVREARSAAVLKVWDGGPDDEGR